MRPEQRFYGIEDDFRSPYARDRDRIIHSGSFRKLEYKTQVFLNQEGDFFRTRLTHSIEVSQIARSVAADLGLREPLAEAIALAHDLGHTPFGHVGGDTLDACLRDKGHANGFEHNFQSFRVVTSLEKRYRNFDGLNLTFATLEGILKHSYPYKKAFLPSWVDEAFDLSVHPSVEAMIVDRADEIAYMSHDIDDGVHSGLITFETLRQNELISEVLEKVHAEGIDPGDDEMFRYRFSSHFINHLVYSMLAYSRERVADAGGQRLSSGGPLPVGFEPGLETRIKQLKKLLYRDLYRHQKILRRTYAGKQAIRGLYLALDEEPKMLPRYFHRQLETRAKHRVIADYIASMSDRFAMKLFNELYGRI